VKYKYTFLPKIFGYYKLIRKVKKKKTNFYFIIMMNVFSTKKKIHLRFDLKGSKLGREVLKQKEKNKLDYEGILGKYNYALKDLDFDFFKKEIHIDSEIRDKIIEQLKIDSLLHKIPSVSNYKMLVPGLILQEKRGSLLHIFEEIQNGYETAIYQQVISMLGLSGKMLSGLGIGKLIAYFLGIRTQFDPISSALNPSFIPSISPLSSSLFFSHIVISSSLYYHFYFQNLLN